MAKKSLTGTALTEEDARWIESYGVTLAGFHFYYGNSYEVPRDDFPIVTRVFSNPLTDSMLYAGLARPQALYVIVPDGDSQQLYRGAVLTYREFVRPNTQLLDDESWREMVSKARTPPAPLFTRSFYAETSVTELMNRLQALAKNKDPSYGDIEEVLYEHPKVLEAAVVSSYPSPSTDGAGENNAPVSPFIKAVVVLKRGEKATPDELLALCRERLDAYKVPRQIEFRTELPKNLVGKVLRRLLIEA